MGQRGGESGCGWVTCYTPRELKLCRHPRQYPNTICADAAVFKTKPLLQ